MIENETKVVRISGTRHGASPTARIWSANSRLRPALSRPPRKRPIALIGVVQ